MNDRVSTYPGRVTLVPVAGQENKYDMVMADEPTQEGTPPTKANLLKDSTAKLIGSAGTVNDALHSLAIHQPSTFQLFMTGQLRSGIC